MAMDRRDFLRSSLGAVLASQLFAAGGSRPKILLRSSWQTVNIGDIAHTPGVLAILEKHIPEAEVTLWPSNVGHGVKEMLLRTFPKLKIAQGEAVKKAIAENDFLLHGSGPSLMAKKDLARWRKETDKPYGVYGITFSDKKEDTKAILNEAAFVFFRDSVSLEFAKKQGIDCPIMEFGPDGAFGVTVRDDAKAEAFLKEHGLEEGKFFCCIGRLRNTPYWKIHGRAMSETDKKKHAKNELMKEHDHVPLREAIIKLARETDYKVLVCPEDASQMAVGKELLVDPLPEDVKKRVVWRDQYWLTDEAVSTYVRSAGLFGNEMHSPIMCVGNGIPAIVCRWAEQTSKGYMWRDIGLGDWLFDHEKDEPAKGLVKAVMGIANDPEGAREKTAKARAFVQKRQRETMGTLEKEL